MLPSQILPSLEGDWNTIWRPTGGRWTQVLSLSVHACLAQSGALSRRELPFCYRWTPTAKVRHALEIP